MGVEQKPIAVGRVKIDIGHDADALSIPKSVSKRTC